MRACDLRGPALASVILLLMAACGQDAVSPTPSASSAPSDPLPPTASDAPTTAPSEEPEGSAFAGVWEEVTSSAVGETAEWTNKVELADLDLDGDVDLLFANGGDYEAPGDPVASAAWLNAGDGTFTDATGEVLGEHALLTRVIKVGDLNDDRLPDIVMGTTFDTQSRLLLSSGPMAWTDVTADHLPAAGLSVGDLELGDVDGDLDLDLLLADWGDGNPFEARGLVTLWLNDGTGRFTDATAERMPSTVVGFSWELELVDVDNDWDLDVATSCKVCDTSLLYENDGAGTFTDVTAGRMPPTSNNYEFTPIDLDRDGYLDLVTINDGIDAGRGFPEHVFRNDGTGSFDDGTDAWWPADANPGFDDNVVVALDVESDGDADFLIGSLDGPDRLLVNDGSGVLTMADDVFAAPPGRGTLFMGIADLDGDGRLDVVEAQGEVAGHEAERVYFGTDDLPPDTAAPIVATDLPATIDGETVIHARVHDNRTPHQPFDFISIVVRWGDEESPMGWVGEHLFVAQVPVDPGTVAEVCATDRAGNETCVEGGE